MPDKDDPFFSMDEEKTIIKPSPGGRRPAASRPASTGPAPEPGRRVELENRKGLNPLERSAAILLNLLSQIRNTSSHPNPTALHKQLASEISQFERRAQQEGLSPETIYMARYVLCSTVDEFVMSTPWGATSIWAQQSLLSLFHKETRGGEKVFRLLDKLRQDPARNLDLLELIYLSLSLGFQGRYRVQPNGQSELEQIREDLYYTLRNQRGEHEDELSPNWRGLQKTAMGKTALIPGWMATAIVLMLLVGMYAFWKFSIASHAEPVYGELLSVGGQDSLHPNRVLARPMAQRIVEDLPDRFPLAEFLAPEVQAGEVILIETPESVTVRISGDGLFESGSDVVKASFHPLIARIGEGLEQARGRIQVTGHTDNIPVSRSSRFASNFELSERRADSVVRLLSAQVSKPERMFPEGRGHTNPIAPNDSPDGRAVNRRVEITLLERARGS